jgi:uncharacterized protein
VTDVMRRSGGLPEIHTRGDGKRVISGYAAVFYRENDPGTEFRLYNDVVERIAPGAFSDAIKSGDVRALFNHDANFVLGRQPNTLRLFEDERGLRYEIDAPASSWAADLMISLERGDIKESSFGFIPTETVYKRLEGDTVAVIRSKVQLIDVGPVAFAAYKSTEATVRAEGAEQVRSEVDAFLKQSAPSAVVSRDAVNARLRVLSISEY